MDTFSDFVKWAGSQARAAKMLGFSKSYVCRLVNGDLEMTRQVAERVEEVSHGLFRKERVLWSQLAQDGKAVAAPCGTSAPAHSAVLIRRTG